MERVGKWRAIYKEQRDEVEQSKLMQVYLPEREDGVRFERDQKMEESRQMFMKADTPAEKLLAVL